MNEVETLRHENRVYLKIINSLKDEITNLQIKVGNLEVKVEDSVKQDDDDE